MAKHERWHPPLYEQEDIRAIQSLMTYANTAVSPDDNVPAPSASEVKRALDWIILNACGTYDEPFTPNQSDVRDYLLGRRSVGLAIVKLSKLKPEIINARK